MKNIKKKLLNTTLIITLALIYTLFIPVKSGLRPLYTIDSIVDTTGDIVSGGNSNGYYIHDDEIGFFDTGKGTLSYKYRSSDGKLIAGNNYGYVLYDKFGDTVTFFGNDGVKRAEIKSPCYPFVPELYPVVYLIKTNGMGFSSYLISGEPLMSDFSTNSLITAINPDKNLNSSVSLTDGKSVLLNKDGEPLINVESEDSSVIIAKSSIADDKGALFFTITGINPEQMSIYNVKTGTLIDRFKTGGDVRYAPMMRTCGNRVYYEGVRVVKVFDTKLNRQNTIDLKGDLKEMDISPSGEILVVTENGKMKELSILSATGVLLYSKRFVSSVSNARFINNEFFYFKIDSNVVVVKRGVGA